mgnify:CR=1 FL=1
MEYFTTYTGPPTKTTRTRGKDGGGLGREPKKATTPKKKGSLGT